MKYSLSITFLLNCLISLSGQTIFAAMDVGTTTDLFWPAEVLVHILHYTRGPNLASTCKSFYEQYKYPVDININEKPNFISDLHDGTITHLFLQLLIKNKLTFYNNAFNLCACGYPFEGTMNAAGMSFYRSHKSKY